jgi:hypothetical protein
MLVEMMDRPKVLMAFRRGLWSPKLSEVPPLPTNMTCKVGFPGYAWPVGFLSMPSTHVRMPFDERCP